MDRTTRESDWQTIAVDQQHPDHPELTGDVCRRGFPRAYQMLVYNEARDNYDRYTVPFAWAKQFEVAEPTKGVA